MLLICLLCSYLPPPESDDFEINLTSNDFFFTEEEHFNKSKRVKKYSLNCTNLQIQRKKIIHQLKKTMFLSEQIFLSNSCQPILCSTFKVPLELVLNQSQHIGNKQRHGQSSVPEYTQKLEEGRIHNDEAQSKDTTDWTEQTNRLLRETSCPFIMKQFKQYGNGQQLFIVTYWVLFNWTLFHSAHNGNCNDYYTRRLLIMSAQKWKCPCSHDSFICMDLTPEERG